MHENLKDTEGRAEGFLVHLTGALFEKMQGQKSKLKENGFRALHN